MKWTKKDVTRLKKLWKKGDKIKMIAVKMGRTLPSVVAKVSALQRKGELEYRHKDGGKGLQPVHPNESEKALRDRTNSLEIAKHLKQSKSPKKEWAKSTKEDWDKLNQYLESKHPYTKLGKTAHRITEVCDEIKSFLVSKNQAYGDSAIHPIRIFSKSDASEQLKVRIDDKLNRLMQGNDSIEADEDVVKDLIGYLVLLLIQMKDE